MAKALKKYVSTDLFDASAMNFMTDTYKYISKRLPLKDKFNDNKDKKTIIIGNGNHTRIHSL